MKFLITFICGFIPGVVLTTFAVLANGSFDNDNELEIRSPKLELPVAGEDVVTVAVGETDYDWMVAKPAGTNAPDVAGMDSAFAVTLSSTDGGTSVAYVVRMRAITHAGKPLLGAMIDRSAWHVIVPRRGSFIIESDDNVWGFARRMAFTMLRGETWRGNIEYVTTVGPLSGTASVYGVSGTFERQTGRAQLRANVREASMAMGITREKATLFIDLAENLPPEPLAETP